MSMGITWEEGSSAEEELPLDWAVDKSVGNCLDLCGKTQPTECGYHNPHVVLGCGRRQA